MTKLTQYTEAFWGSEYTSTAGYDVLSRHNSEEKKFLQEFEEFLRKRYKIELDYSKAIGQLAKSMKEHSDIGVLALTWNCLRTQMDACKMTHEEAGLFFNQHAEETKRFNKDITSRRDTKEDRLKKIQNQKASQFKNVTSLCKTYGLKCREQDQAAETLNVQRRAVTSTVKDLDKAQSKMEKTAEEAKKADVAYKNAVDTLEATRQDWEREMEQACREFQEYDEEQIVFMRSELWSAVNRVSQVAVDVDECCEKVRKVLETCDVDTDIQSFIAANTTGTERPEPVVYQNYYQNILGSISVRAAPSAPPATQHGHPMTIGNDSSHYYTTPGEPDSHPTYSLADPTYSQVETVSEISPRQLTVSMTFRSPPDFVVHAGEKVTFVAKVTNSMVQVRNSSRKMGNIPVSCIKEPI